MSGSSEDLASLVARAKSGDRAALEAVLASVAPSIHRFGLRMCRNAHDADDILQDTLLNIANHLGDFEGRSSLSSWVFSLTRSACARKRRGLKNRPHEGDDRLVGTPDPSPTPETTTADRELAAVLSRALDGLSDDHREVIFLRDVEGLSAPEAASSLGISVEALKSRLHRAREALRLALKPAFEPEATPDATGCPDIVALWSKNLEGDLSQRDCSAMQQHMEGCARCGAACSALKRALGACAALRTETVPARIQEEVRAAVRAWAPKTL